MENKELVFIIAGKLNNGNTLYWKTGTDYNKIKEVANVSQEDISVVEEFINSQPEIGDYAIVENKNGFDLVKIVGIMTTEKKYASLFSTTKYENMKSLKKIIKKDEIVTYTEKIQTEKQ